MSYSNDSDDKSSSQACNKHLSGSHPAGRRPGGRHGRDLHQGHQLQVSHQRHQHH